MCPSNLIKLVKTINNFYFTSYFTGKSKPFVVGDYQVGYIRNDIEKKLREYPKVFHTKKHYVVLNPRYKTLNDRSAAIADVLNDMRNDPEIVTLQGWRNESMAVAVPLLQKVLFKVERSALPLFGLRLESITIVGYVCHPEKGLCIWKQKRSSTKPVWPGYWDSFVSGGIHSGSPIDEQVIKEAFDEASLSEKQLKFLLSTGSVSFIQDDERGIHPLVMYVYELELPLDFTPRNMDGEVEAFHLFTANECLEMLTDNTNKIKITGEAVLIDFLIKKSVINIKNEPELQYLIEMLHVPVISMYIWPRIMVI